MLKLKELAEKDFNDAINQNETILVDFYSPTCSPCAQLVSVLDETIKKHIDLKIYKIDVNKANGLSAKYHILSLPTLLFFRQGQVVREMVGSINSTEIEEFILKN